MEKMLQQKLAEAIRSLRLEKGMTQERFAEELSLSKNQLQNIERMRSYPSLRLLERLHEKYGFSVDRAMDGDAQREDRESREYHARLKDCPPEAQELIRSVVAALFRAFGR